MVTGSARLPGGVGVQHQYSQQQPPWLSDSGQSRWLQVQFLTPLIKGLMNGLWARASSAWGTGEPLLVRQGATPQEEVVV